ncbi:RNA polymerase sigma-H factor [Mesobacillus persicus]|uniref:RNA polymerase sigma-H factor n=1 Tax=Mesobacillus persicus TaxID=930146 RepID=A0A1H7XNY1_9BACI|nr:sigma-70 family RNA polymerase sigma factor [Mesobacillus persicus]SEM35612.1 RNA polymerase sigma-H factor [Mesobacillus persicus]
MSHIADIDMNVLKQAQQGDERAINEIIQKCEPIVKSFQKKIFIPGADRDDIFQIGCMGMMEAIEAFNPEKVENGNFQSWCRRFVKHKILGELNRSKNNKHLALNESHSYDALLPDGDDTAFIDYASHSEQAQISLSYEFVDPSKQVETNDTVKHFKQYKEETFTEMEKQIFELSLEGYSYSEIGEKVGINRKKVDNALYRAKGKVQEFKTQLEKEPNNPEAKEEIEQDKIQIEVNYGVSKKNQDDWKKYDVYKKIKQAEEMLTIELHRKPTIEEIVQQAGIRKEKYYEIEFLLFNGTFESLEELATKPDDEKSNEELVVEYKYATSDNRKEEIKEVLITRNEKFIYHFIYKLSPSARNDTFLQEDLYQIGVIGFLEALENYDVTQIENNKFISFAGQNIKWGIKRELGKQNQQQNGLPVNAYYEIRKIRKTKAKLKEELKREPNDEELASALEVSMKLLKKYKSWEENFNTYSLDAEIKTSSYKDESTTTLKDTLVNTTFDEPDNGLDKMDIQDLLIYLNEKERDIIEKRYYDVMTLEQIGEEYGITREAIRQLEEKALEKLKAMMTNENLDVLLRKNINEEHCLMLEYCALPFAERLEELIFLYKKFSKDKVARMLFDLQRGGYITYKKGWNANRKATLTPKGKVTVNNFHKAYGLVD